MDSYSKKRNCFFFLSHTKLPGRIRCCWLVFVLALIVWGLSLSYLHLAGDKGYRTVTDRHPNVRIATQRDFTSIDSAQERAKPQTNIYYLKVHKTGSSTFNHVLKMYAMKNDLKYPMFKVGDTFPNPNMNDFLLPIDTLIEYAQNHELTNVSQEEIARLSNVPRDQVLAENRCNVIDTHTVCNKTAIYEIMPRDTVFVVTVRHPFKQFMSAANNFHFWKKSGLEARFEDPIGEFLRDPPPPYVKLERPGPLENFQAFTMGCNVSLNSDDEIQSCVKYANETFHVAILAEKYTEGLIIFKNYMKWSTKEILYLSVNVKYYPEKDRQFTDSQYDAHKKISPFDYAVYDMFLKRHEKLVAELGEEFAQEVEDFKDIVSRVSTFCHSVIVEAVNRRDSVQIINYKTSSYLLGKTIHISPKYDDWFTVNGTECLLMGYCSRLLLGLMYTKQHYPWLCHKSIRNFLYVVGSGKWAFVYNDFCTYPDKSFEYNYPIALLRSQGYLI